MDDIAFILWSVGRNNIPCIWRGIYGLQYYLSLGLLDKIHFNQESRDLDKRGVEPSYGCVKKLSKYDEINDMTEDFHVDSDVVLQIITFRCYLQPRTILFLASFMEGYHSRTNFRPSQDQYGWLTELSLISLCNINMFPISLMVG